MKRRYFNFSKVLLACVLSCLIGAVHANAVEVTTQDVVVTYAGTGAAGNTNGAVLSATFNSPTYMTIDPDGNFYIPSGNGIRVIESGQVFLYTGDIGNSGGAVPNPGTPPPAKVASTITAARYYQPQSLAFDNAGNLWVADTLNYSVRRIKDSSNQVISAAGTGLAASDNSTASAAGNAAAFNLIGSLAVDGAGNVYVGTYGGATNFGAYVVKKLTGGQAATSAENVTVSLFAGKPGDSGTTNGDDADPLTAEYDALNGGMVVDTLNQKLYIVDNGNFMIRYVNLSGSGVGTVGTTAGAFGSGSGYEDGVLTAAKFGTIKGIAIDASGNLYVSDAGNQVIRKIDIAGDAVTTIAGVASSSGDDEGPVDSAKFYNPANLVFDSTGTLYIADSGNHKIRQIIAIPDFTEFADAIGLFPGVSDLAATLTEDAITYAITHNTAALAELQAFLDLTPDEQYGALVNMLDFSLPPETPYGAVELQNHLLALANQLIADGEQASDAFNFIETIFQGTEEDRQEALIGLLPIQYPMNILSVSNAANHVFEMQGSRLFGMRADALLYRKKKQLKDLSTPSRFISQHAGVADRVQLRHEFNANNAVTPLTFAEDRGGMWIQPFSHHLKYRPNCCDNGFRDRLHGFMGGVDYRATENRIYGLSLGHFSSKVNFDNNVGNGRINGHFISPYFSGSTDQYAGELALLFAKHRINMTRHSGEDTFTSTERARSLGIHGRGERSMEISPNWAWAPYIAEDYLILHTSGYDEEGGDGALSVGGRNPAFLRSEIGAQLNGAFPLSKAEHAEKLLFQGWVSYVNKIFVQGESASIIIDPLPGAFSFESKQRERNFLTVGLGVQYIGPRGLFASTNYSTEYSHHSTAHKWALNLGSRF